MSCQTMLKWVMGLGCRQRLWGLEGKRKQWTDRDAGLLKALENRGSYGF